MTTAGHNKWRKSSYSGNGENCVEVLTTGTGVGVRDSKSPASGHVMIESAGWATFLRTITGNDLRQP